MCTQWERETKGCVLVCFCFGVCGCMVISSTLTLQQQYTPTAAVPHGAPSWSWPGQRALESWALFQAGDGLGEDEEDKDENEEEAVLRVIGYTDTSSWNPVKDMKSVTALKHAGAPCWADWGTSGLVFLCRPGCWLHHPGSCCEIRYQALTEYQQLLFHLKTVSSYVCTAVEVQHFVTSRDISCSLETDWAKRY